MESALEVSQPVEPQAKRMRWRLKLQIFIVLVLVALIAKYALSPKGPSAYERWFATIHPAEVQAGNLLGDVPQADPEPNEEIDILALGKVKGSQVEWKLRYKPEARDERALRILELAREADAFPDNQLLSPEEIAQPHDENVADDSITLIVSTKEGGFKSTFGPNELANNVKLATMLRLFENFASQDAIKERY